jgi:beta-N-acetylglucosaminidase
MKVRLIYVRVFLILTLITSLINSTPVKAGDDLICTEAQFSVVSLNLDQTKTILACSDTFESAKESMSLLNVDYPDLIITHISSKSPEKIIAATRAIAASYPQRRNDGTANAAIMYIYKNQNHTGDSTYMNAYRDMAYYDTLTYDTTTGTGSVQVQISGFVGFAHLNQVDIIPMIYIENDWLISLGGNSFTGSLAVYQIRPRMNEYRVSTSSTYGVREIYHETFSFFSASSLGVYVYGQAPDWLSNGTYYSWDSIHFFKDKAMTQPVLNGETVGEYYNYYQYLPLRSSSNLSAKQLDDYLIALGFTKKATYYGEPDASAMYGEGKAFVDGQLKYGANALLVYAMGLHESGRGTSRLSIEKNNIFGWGAVDSNPSDAYLFESVALSVAEHMGRNLRGYMSVENYRFFGSILGNKNNGFNTKYASDPYWGNKISGWAYRIDRYYGFPDFNYYAIGLMPDSGDLAVKKTADASSATMFTIPSKRVQRSVLINSLTETENGSWVSIMSTQPVTLADVVVMYNSTLGEVTPYEWFMGIGYLPSNDIKMIYTGNGISKIPLVYDEEEFKKDPIVQIETLGLGDGLLSIVGYAFKPGLSVSIGSVASYQLMLVNEEGVIIPISLPASTERLDINATVGSTRFDYKGAGFSNTFNIDQLLAGKYRLDLYASFNVLSDPVFFTESITTDIALPQISNFEGRSYELTRDVEGVLTLVVEDVELIVLKGDVNGDGKVTITDLVMMHLTISGIDTFSEFVNRNADMNSDGKISITDMVMLHLLISGIEY